MTAQNKFFFKPLPGLLLIFLLSFFVGCDERELDLSEMEKIVKEVNKKCPALIDSETQLDGIELLENNIIRYNYTLVHVFANNVDTHDFNLNMYPGILSFIKVSPEMQKMRDNKMFVHYHYRDRDHKTVYTFKISPADYLK